MHIRIMKHINQPYEDPRAPAETLGEPYYETMIDCMRVDHIPLSIGLGRQEITFEGFEGIDPNTVFFVDGVRQHYKRHDPADDMPRMMPAVQRRTPEIPFIDATVYVR